KCPAVERSLDRALTIEAVADEEGPDQAETSAGDRVRPAGHVADAGDDLAEADADGQRGQAGAPPGEIGPLVGEPRAASGVHVGEPRAASGVRHLRVVAAGHFSRRLDATRP